MIRFSENEALSSRHTFGIQASSRYFLETDNHSELFDFVKTNRDKFLEFLILGEGSNILFTTNYEGSIIHLRNDDISIHKEDEKEIVLQCGAALNWDRFVEWTVKRSYGGLENLSNIPGSVGAAPVQNIGAYGVEAKDFITEVHVVDLDLLEDYWISSAQCSFAYRNSIFKKPENKKLLVWEVRFRLLKEPTLNLTYKGLKDALPERSNIGIKDVREAIILLRSQKLPDPKIIGNAGSFFKNPVIPDNLAENIQKEYPEMPLYPGGKNGYSKLAAAWLIEKCGLKGIKKGNVGTYKNQALVLVNHGGASGKELSDMASEIQEIVFEKFDIELQAEVLII